jgi:UPF0755 protein
MKKMKALKAKYLLIAAAVCLVSIVALGWYFFLTDFSDTKETRYVYVDDDDTIDSVLTKLRPIATDHGLTGFGTLIRHSDYAKAPRTGRYAIEPGEKTWKVMRKMKNGQQQAVMLTIPEARTMQKLAAALGSKLMLDSAQIAAALTDQVYCQQQGYDTCTIAALFVPNTYEVYWNTTLDHFMERMAKEHKAFWTPERLQKCEVAGLSPDEVCTLASIIDEETANNGEKPMIAGMYLNRLHKDMPLQADPTVKFALKNFALKRIYHDMLFFDSPYNTYRNTGLPPGPIKIASIKGIDAVLNYVQHDYLYMCAKEDFSGTHNFAVSYAEHLRNAARYAKALNERGIK